MKSLPSDDQVVIESGGVIRDYASELWRYRELLYFLARRDILVRYSDATLGVLWAIFRPVSLMVMFTFVFKNVAGMSTGNIPYPLFALSAVLPWQLFSSSISDIGTSLGTNSRLISKVYFPKLLIPLASLVVNLLDFLISLALFFVAFVVYSHPVHYEVIWLPIAILICAVLATGIGLWFSALIARYRDLRHVLPFLIPLGLFVSPIGFSSDAVPPRWEALFSLNPLVGIIDLFRFTLLGLASHSFAVHLATSCAITILVTWSGFLFFRKTERLIADLV